MNTLTTTFRKSLLPVFGLLLTLMLVNQMRAMKGGGSAAGALERLGVKTAAAEPAVPALPVEDGAPLLTVADLRRTRIEAEVDELDAGRVAVGAPVEVKIGTERPSAS
jgi:hypothetical protein